MPDARVDGFFRYSADAPHRDSSGTGSWKSRDVALASQGGDRHAWALGSTLGENVEIDTSPRAARRGSVGVGNLTMVKILFCFWHTDNELPGGEGNRAVREWVAGYEYASAAPGQINGIRRHAATHHPVLI